MILLIVVALIVVVPTLVLLAVPWFLKFFSWYYNWVLYSPPKNVGRL